jgi:hypothetical protein
MQLPRSCQVGRDFSVVEDGVMPWAPHCPDDWTYWHMDHVNDIKLNDAVQTNAGKHWNAIAALVPGRTKTQCRDRGFYVLDISINCATEAARKWTPEEDNARS